MTAREIIEGLLLHSTGQTAPGPDALFSEARAYLKGPSKAEEALIKAGAEFRDAQGPLAERWDSALAQAVQIKVNKAALTLPLPSKPHE